MTASNPMPTVPEEIRSRHDPMDSEDRGYILCARCDEIWPCDAARLIAIIEEAHERVGE